MKFFGSEEMYAICIDDVLYTISHEQALFLKGEKQIACYAHVEIFAFVKGGECIDSVSVLGGGA